MNKKNLVYIFGAGSSKEFGYPLGDEIFEAAHQHASNVKYPNIGAKLEAAVNEVDQVMTRIYSNLPSEKRRYPFFEEVLTFIWHARKYEYQDWNNNGKIVSIFEQGTTKVLKIFIEMLLLTFSSIQHFNNQVKELEEYQRFIKSLKFNEKNISIISLNYDLLIDNALFACVKEGLIEDFSYDVPLYQLGKEFNIQSICRKKGIALLKPHGSLNLSFCTGHKQEGDVFYYSEDDITLDVMNRTDRAKCPISNCRDSLTPLIIPPLYMKESYISETNKSKVWISKRGMKVLDEGVVENYRWSVDRRVSNVLQNADEIVIIGYSMPPYDFDFKSLLIKGFMANKNRANVPVSIITKGEGKQLDDLRLRFNHLAGEVRFIGQDGFLSYIKSFGL